MTLACLQDGDIAAVADQNSLFVFGIGADSGQVYSQFSLGYSPRKSMNLRGKALIDNLCHSDHNRIYSRFS